MTEATKTPKIRAKSCIPFPSLDGLAQPEKHLSFWGSGGGNGRIQCVDHGCEQLEMFYQHLGKILSLSGSHRQYGAKTPLLAADQIHRRMVWRKTLGWTRQSFAFKLAEGFAHCG